MDEKTRLPGCGEHQCVVSMQSSSIGKVVVNVRSINLAIGDFNWEEFDEKLISSILA